MLAIVVIFAGSTSGSAYATSNTTLQQVSLTGDALKNNPYAAKILAEIQYSKQQIAQLEKDQKNKEVNDQLISQQRKIASNLEQQALQVLQIQSQQNSSTNSYNRFLATIPNNNTKGIFEGEFDFMKQRTDTGHEAMKKVLSNGGTWEQAMSAFSQYAAIKRTEMVSMNQELNIKYNMADVAVQSAFDKNGVLPDGYVKTADEINHGQIKN